MRGGCGIRSEARKTGLSRTTIKKGLKDDKPPQDRRTHDRIGHKPSADFEERLRERLGHVLQLRRRDCRLAKKLFKQIVPEGCTESYPPVQRFVREVKQTTRTGIGEAFVPLHFAAGIALQIDRSEEHVVSGGVEQKVRVAHFRLCRSRKPFVVVHPNEKQETVREAFVRALAFFGGVLRRVIIDRPKTMVVYVSRSKDRVFHPRFLALMNHGVIEPPPLSLGPMALR